MFPVESNILIVDDSNLARTTLKNALTELGYWRIVDFDSVKPAQNFLLDADIQKDPTHLLIVDLHMPELSGHQLVKWLREQDKFKKLPIIVLTSSQETSDVLAIANLGVSHFMLKPVTAQLLRQRLTTAWTKHGESYVKQLNS